MHCHEAVLSQDRGVGDWHREIMDISSQPGVGPLTSAQAAQGSSDALDGSNREHG